MSLRLRILLAVCLLVLLPILVLSIGGRRQASRRLETQYRQRLETLSAVADQAFARRSEDLARRLVGLKAEMSVDPRLRLSLVDRLAAERSYRLDYAARLMPLMGLDFLQVQDDEGHILSSGHYRDEFDRREAALPAGLARCPDGSALIRARRPGGDFHALARVDSVDMGGIRFWLIGGLAVTDDFVRDLAGGSGLDIALHHGFAASEVPAGAAESKESGWEPGEITGAALPDESDRRFITERRALELPSLTASGERGRTELLLSYPAAPLAVLIRGYDLWLLLALAGSLLGTVILAGWLSSRISRPIRELADKTERVDLDSLNVDFASERADEVGVLSRFLNAMTARLAAGARRLREAERRITLAELSRQVTHDIRNGFTPIRNVIAHLSQVARDEPGRLSAVYRERQGTLESGLSYLEDLAQHYSRLAPRSDKSRCSLNELLQDILPESIREPGVEYRRELDEGLPLLTADPISLRRIAENLLRNARESLPTAGGVVTLRTRKELDAGGDLAILFEVEDTGCGIDPEQQDRIFEDFYTSKTEGSGLGLSIVRRLVADLGGRLSVESEPGRGSCFSVSLPADAPSGKEEEPK